MDNTHLFDESALCARVADGLSSTALADEFDCSRSTINRRVAKIGVTITGNRRVIAKTCRQQVQSMKASEAVEYLLDVVEELCSGQDDDLVTKVISHGFTPTESQILLAIFSTDMMSKDRLFAAIYGARASGEMPEIKIIDVLICKIRNKLKSIGWPVSIETLWGRGYYGVRAEGFLFPWETAQ